MAVAILIQILQNRSVPSEVGFMATSVFMKIQDHMCFSPFIPLEYSKSYPSYHRNNKKTVVAIISNFSFLLLPDIVDTLLCFLTRLQYPRVRPLLCVSLGSRLRPRWSDGFFSHYPLVHISGARWPGLWGPHGDPTGAPSEGSVLLDPASTPLAPVSLPPAPLDCCQYIILFSSFQ